MGEYVCHGDGLVAIWAWTADADPAGEGAAVLAALLAQLSFTAAGAFVDGELPAGSGGRDADRRAGLLVAAAERRAGQTVGGYAAWSCRAVWVKPGYQRR